jgi:hypothetical protein
VDRELACDLEAWPPPSPVAAGHADRELLDVRGSGVAGRVADLVAAGDSVLVLSAHAEHRRDALRDRVGGFALACWDRYDGDPGLAAAFDHVVVLDPPPHRHAHDALSQVPGSGYTHLAWGEQELDLTRRILQWEHSLREPLTALYRGLRSARHADGPACVQLLRGEGRRPHTPALAARLVRLLGELGLATHTAPLALAATDPPPRAPLESCAAYRSYARRLDEGLRWLSSGETTRRHAA